MGLRWIGQRLAPAALVTVLLAAANPAAALDVFTLWRQPEVPLRLEAGAWVDYRTQVMTGGRRQHGVTRLACLGRDGGGEDASWILEILPLAERDDGALVPIKEDAVRLEVAPALLHLAPGSGLSSALLPLASCVMVFGGLMGAGLLLLFHFLTRVPIMPVGDRIFLGEFSSGEEGS